MFKRRRIVAVIPARSRSKGLPNKNIKDISGKPLIYWTINEALKSDYIDKVIVSTDGPKVAAVARKCGADVPFLRPKHLSCGKASSADALLHAIERLEDMGDKFDIFILLQPTSPLREAGDIDKAIEILLKKKAKSIISVSEVMHPPLWMNTLPSNGSMDKFLSAQIVNRNRQSLKKYFMPNGAIFAGHVQHFKKAKRFYVKGSYAYVMPRSKAIDIDDIVDFKLAEVLLGEAKRKRRRVSAK